MEEHSIRREGSVRRKKSVHASDLAEGSTKRLSHHKNKASISQMARGVPAAKKLKMLRKRDEERQARIQAEVESWFEKFDENKDGKLQRDELRNLLNWLHPSRPPSEENLDFLLVKATEIVATGMRVKGNKDGAVAWHQARQTVLDYGDYLKDQMYIDSIFSRFDSDNSGTLEASELLPLLQALGPEGCAVDDTDVEFVLSSFDVNSDGMIDRSELLPMLAKWAQIAYTKLEQQRLELFAQERQNAAQAAWKGLKIASVVTGDAAHAAAVGGNRMLQLARLAKAKQSAQARSKWHMAGDAHTAEGSSKKILRLVAQAKQQQKFEDESSRLVTPREGEGSPPKSKLLAKLKKKQSSKGFLAVGKRSPDSSVSPEVSRGGSSDGTTEASSSSSSAAAAESTVMQQQQLVHSRSDATAAMDRDRPWERRDTTKHKLHKQKTQALQAKREGAPKGGSSLCVIL